MVARTSVKWFLSQQWQGAQDSSLLGLHQIQGFCQGDSRGQPMSGQACMLRTTSTSGAPADQAFRHVLNIMSLISEATTYHDIANQEAALASNTLQAAVSAMPRSQSAHSWKSRITQSKGASSLKPSSGKEDFKEWVNTYQDLQCGACRFKTILQRHNQEDE